MGAGATKGPTAVGAPVNPRVQYSRKLEKQEQKKVLVDAPVLVDVEHGSVRYRQPQTEQPPVKSLKGKECPYENEKGKELDNKEHYFYHTRLNKYGPESSKAEEDAFKFYYVLKGPAAAQHKKLFYIYGQGWEAQDGLKVKPTETVGVGKDYAWSSSRNPNSLYYALQFDGQVETENSEEDKILSDLESSPDKSSIQLTVSSEDRMATVKARMSVKLLKSTKDIHIAYENKELRDEDVIGGLHPKTDEDTGEEPKDFRISLTLV
ncbi:uncharacterized protein LOC101862939 [Aplysia californica]|uniref:Uncharacterized protein LOC101862939 n=1 Tax=Aplysia californica TaxID=6500 RepID=A0ABM1VRR0_APLCA|nr:uncharacterized protein LOC101862939 [Aplysia californica]XP_035825102.1 uncharacterized protein LOC101862939 [Aplysia californica]